MLKMSTWLMRKLTFSDNDIAVSKRVFTCGYNSNLKERSFFSGSLVKLVSKFFLFIFSIQFWCLIFENYNSGVGIRNKTSKDATLYLHGSSTGIWGYVGSAVWWKTTSRWDEYFVYNVQRWGLCIWKEIRFWWHHCIRTWKEWYNL